MSLIKEGQLLFENLLFVIFHDDEDWRKDLGAGRKALDFATERVRRLIDIDRKHEQTSHCLGELLAVLFGDGGHKQAEIGDDEKAVEEAKKVVYASRELVDNLQYSDSNKRIRIRQLEDDIAEYQGKPEAFERLRGLLKKEKQMRKEGDERSQEIIVGLREEVKLMHDVAHGNNGVVDCKPGPYSHPGYPSNVDAVDFEGLEDVKEESYCFSRSIRSGKEDGRG